MTASEKTHKLPGVFPLLRDAIGLYRAHWDIFLGYAGWLFLPLILSLAAFLAFESETAQLVHAGFSQLLLILLISWLHILVILLVPLLNKDQPIPFHRIGKQAVALLIPYLITTLVVEFFELTGLILLIIPGLYIGTILAFAPIITVRKGLGLIESIKASAALSKGRVLAILGRLLGGALVLGLVLLISWIGIEIARTLIAGGGLQGIFLSPPSLVTEIIYQALLVLFLPAFMIYHMLLYLALDKFAKDS